MRMSVSRSISLAFVLAAGLAILLLPGAEVAQASSHPTISSVAITSTPTIDSDQDGTVDTYGVGEHIEVTVAFNETVSVTGTPRLEIAVGSSNRQAAYNPGSGTASLVFRYTVVAADTDADGVSVAANKLTLNSGTIKDAADNAASLTHAALAAQSGHKVDGTRTPGPRVTSMYVSSNPASGDTYGVDEVIEIAVQFFNVVSVTGRPQLEIAVGTNNRQAVYSIGGGSSQLFFRYTVVEGESGRRRHFGRGEQAQPQRRDHH